MVDGIRGLEGFLSAAALAEGPDSTLSQGTLTRNRLCRWKIDTEQGLAKRRVPWPVTISMSRTGSRACTDDEGAEFDSFEAAVQAAARSAAEIGTSRLAKGDSSDVILVVRDEQNQRVCTLTASMKIERHDLSHQGPHSWSA